MNDAAYLGPLGGLIRIANYQGGLSSQGERAATERVTTSGVRRVQVSQRANREWSVSSRLDSFEAAQLAALAQGEFGIGPFWFVDPWAQVTNLLHPRASVLEGEPPAGMTIGGPVTLDDGSRAGRSWVVANPTEPYRVNWLDGALHRIPVIAGQAVTGSVYASGAGTVGVLLQWYDAAGTHISNSPYANHTPGASMRRLYVTATPPAGAHSASVIVRGANRIARPALTWTPFLADWHVGQGAPSVAIPATLSQDIILATRESRAGGRLASVSTTIREVG